MPSPLGKLNPKISTNSYNRNWVYLPIGSYYYFAGGQAKLPLNVLPCFGGSYSISGYSGLYNVIGTAYGGSGSTFKVPDTRGSYLIGGGIDLTVNGTPIPSTNIEGSNKSTGGASSVTPTITSTFTATSGSVTAVAAGGTSGSSVTASAYPVTGAVSSSSSAVKIIPPYLATYWCIVCF